MFPKKSKERGLVSRIDILATAGYNKEAESGQKKKNDVPFLGFKTLWNVPIIETSWHKYPPFSLEDCHGFYLVMTSCHLDHHCFCRIAK